MLPRPAALPCQRSLAHRGLTYRHAATAALRPTPMAARGVHITAANASTEPAHDEQHQQPPPPNVDSPGQDARFQVIGSPFSLLSVSLSASQTLYTRRGTLVALSGKAENTRSTLSVLAPFRRAPVGIPFLYHKVSATSPVTALVSTKSPISSIVSVSLDGRQDWLVSQRQALLAWTGHTLTLKPQYNVQLGLAYWGNTYITGRGLLALAGSGQIYQVQVKAGESYVAHPSNVVAYTASTTPPLPFRFKASTFGLQVPDLGFGSLLHRVRFFRVMGETTTWRALATTYYTIKTWTRRTIWGDRLFLRFEGPTTLLLQSRASRISQVLTLRDVNEIAESPPGAVQDAVTRKIQQELKDIAAGPEPPDLQTTMTLKYATMRNGKAEFEKSTV